MNAVAAILLLPVLTTWRLNDKNFRLDRQQQQLTLIPEMASRKRLAI